MLTADELRRIAERDRADRERLARQLAPQEPSPRDAELEAELGPLPSIAEVLRPSRAEEDRGAMLELLRAVAKYIDTDEIEGEHYCSLCRAQVFGPPEARLSLRQDHAADCPAPALEALREK